MNLYINRKPVNGPWGGGNKLISSIWDYNKKFFNIKNITSQRDISNIDCILIVGMDQDEYGFSAEQLCEFKTRFNNDVRIVFRVNENDARKGTTNVDNRIIKLMSKVDHTIFVSKWLQEYFSKKDCDILRSSIIINGVDSSVFKPNIKFNNNKVNIVTSHWSSHDLKGFDIYNQLDEFVGKNSNYTFTYIGREQGKFKNTKVIKPLFGKELGDELGKYDVYVSASRYEPGSNSVLEALSCKIPVFIHINSGGCCEFINNDNRFIFSSFQEFIEKVYYNKHVKQEVKLNSWEECIQQFHDILKG